MQALVDFCAGTLCHVNLIQLNDIPDSPFRPSPIEKVEALQRRLTMHGVETTIRNSRGGDIDAACRASSSSAASALDREEQHQSDRFM